MNIPFQLKLILMFVVASGSTIAQTEKGKFLIGAQSNFDFQFSINNANSDNEGLDGKELSRTTRWQVTPNLGYCINERIVLGLQFPMNYEKFTGNESIVSVPVVNKSLYILAEPYITYFITNTKLRPYINGTIGAGKFWRERTEQTFQLDDGFRTEKLVSNLFRYSLNVGAAYFITKNIGLNLQLGYAHLGSKEQNENLTNDKFNFSSIESRLGFLISL